MNLKSKVGPITAVVVAALAISWMVVGGNGITVSPTKTTAQENTVSSPTAESALAYPVQAKTLIAQSIEMHLPLSGKTLADETLALINSYQGRITQLPIEKGQFVKKGRTIAQIDTRTLQAQIEQADLLVKQKQLELDGIQKLNLQNLSSKVNLAQAQTDLASARATQSALLVDLENANITAPFSGILNSLAVQEGQVLAVGATLGTLVSINPIKVSVNIPQNKIQQIKLGTQGNIRLESGDEAEGFVSYISATANESSRTITVEMQVDNPGNKIPAGLTAAVDFILEEQKAHAFSAALLTLDDAGRTAIKTIDLDNRVVMTPVDIVKSERDQVWVRGLPNNVNIITVGQGFVSVGDKVDAHYQH
ncbi:efflux RND transporter periplasmic adaptor subunit [Marinomonas sp. M1K-6]|uniref:Efflux RND transporter periplasmic adaptor subunit n=1 Tax=Marinomonas profundi TaxID=2726122 RepID=A0A847QZC3_9GAMM|nr:efflux RND transporter periplasmic adaptor subunit [Marinomonas profundi]NLQ18639.1 efflux RND transporter periplasmic adaptor subunit [Marinomonas profundi]UDV02868.1 efflux RND transporter periplasmic adaptor subunit [Marinomonas profundi]